jgi:phosphatidylglycerol:prolipoprotein diacylglycerol transferase
MEAQTLTWITIGIDPVLVRLGPLAIHWYALGWIAGIALAAAVVWPYARARGVSKDACGVALICSIVAGLIGARLCYLLQNTPGTFAHDPLRVPAVWQSGMAFYGAVFGVIAVLALLAWTQHYRVWVLLDAAALGAALGQACGRMGNLVDGDLVGRPTALPWGTAYTDLRASVPAVGTVYQPLAGYALLVDLCLFAVLFGLRNRLPAGRLMVLYLAVYSLVQFVLGFLRDGGAAGLDATQWTALVVVVADLVITGWLWWRPARAATEGNVAA